MSLFRVSLTCVGKAAPPWPTSPARRTAWTISSGPCSSMPPVGHGPPKTSSNRARPERDCSSAALIGTTSTCRPLGSVVTVARAAAPAMLAWTGAETKASESPTTSPTATSARGLSVDLHGAPRCCCKAMRTSEGAGKTSMGASAERLFRSGGCSPRAKVPLPRVGTVSTLIPSPYPHALRVVRRPPKPTCRRPTRPRHRRAGWRRSGQTMPPRGLPSPEVPERNRSKRTPAACRPKARPDRFARLSRRSGSPGTLRISDQQTPDHHLYESRSLRCSVYQAPPPRDGTPTA